MPTVALIAEILQALEILLPAAQGVAALFTKHANGEHLTADEHTQLADIHAAVSAAAAHA